MERDRLAGVLLPGLGVLALLGCWWAAVRVLRVSPLVLPPPGDVLAVLVDQPKELAGQLGATAAEAAEGFGLAVGLGLVLALVISSCSVVRRVAYPLIVVANAVPKLALAPLVLAWFGLGMTAKVVLVLLVGFFPVVVAATAGLAATPPELVELASALRASWLRTFLVFRLPAALPAVFVGVKVAAGLSVIGAVVSEFAGASAGLGFAVNSYSGQGRTDAAFAAVLLLAVLSMLMYGAVAAIERMLLPWAPGRAG